MADPAVNMATNETDPGVCARCADQGPTCCRVQPGQEEFCFPLSEAEWSRILDFAKDKGSFVQEINREPFIHNMQRLFPKERDEVAGLFVEHRPHLRLATDASGACVFLGESGCRLPREARPYYCRIFPFWVYGERLTLFTPGYCLALKEGRNPRQVLASMSLTEGMVRELHGRLRLAWGLPPRPGMRRTSDIDPRRKK